MSYTIILLPLVGKFASNKDVATNLRITQIMPHLTKNEDIILDFAGVEAGNQSFIHALIAEPIQVYGSNVLKHIQFESCSEIIKTLIGLVVDYTTLALANNLNKNN